MIVSVLRQHARPRAPADGRGPAGAEPFEERGHFSTVVRHQYFSSGLEKLLDACPAIADEAGAVACRLVLARRSRIAVNHQADTAEKQHRARRAVEGVVIARIKVSQ